MHVRSLVDAHEYKFLFRGSRVEELDKRRSDRRSVHARSPIHVQGNLISRAGPMGRVSMARTKSP